MLPPTRKSWDSPCCDGSPRSSDPNRPSHDIRVLEDSAPRLVNRRDDMATKNVLGQMLHDWVDRHEIRESKRHRRGLTMTTMLALERLWLSRFSRKRRGRTQESKKVLALYHACARCGGLNQSYSSTRRFGSIAGYAHTGMRSGRSRGIDEQPTPGVNPPSSSTAWDRSTSST